MGYESDEQKELSRILNGGYEIYKKKFEEKTEENTEETEKKDE